MSAEAPTEAEVGALLSAAFHALGTHALSGHTSDLERRLRKALARIIAERVAAERERIATALEEMGPVWGGPASWLTTGDKVASLAASIAREEPEA